MVSQCVVVEILGWGVNRTLLLSRGCCVVGGRSVRVRVGVGCGCGGRGLPRGAGTRETGLRGRGGGGGGGGAGAGAGLAGLEAGLALSLNPGNPSLVCCSGFTFS